MATTRGLPPQDPERMRSLFLSWLRRFIPERARTVVPLTSSEQARAAARERRARCIRALRVDLWLDQIERPPFVGIQQPPFAVGVGEVREVSRREFSDYRYWLSYEIQSDALLLAGRVSDIVTEVVKNIATQGIGFDAAWANLAPAVALHRVPPRMMRKYPDLFPWRVVVSSQHPYSFERAFRESSSWVGIGVDIERRAAPEIYGTCNRPGGMSGKIGGILRIADQQDQGVTCAHVVAPDCCSVSHIEDYRHEETVPDLALLRAQSCCFDIPDQLHPIIYPMNDELADIVGPSTVVYLHRPGKRKRAGIMESFQVVVTHDGRRCTVPSIQIRRMQRRRIVRWPPSWGVFSKPGESGSWVVSGDISTWYGMVIGGDKNRSWAHTPQAILHAVTMGSGGPESSEFVGFIALVGGHG